MVDSVREKRRVLTEVVCRSLGLPPPPSSDCSLPQVAFANESPPPPPRVAAALTGLDELVQTSLQNLKREALSKLDQIVSHYYIFDWSRLFASEVGNVIRSFQAVDAETLSRAADASAEKARRDDLALLFRLGATASIDTLVDGKTALIRAVYAGSLPAVEMLVEEGASLEVEGEEEGFEGFTALHRACYERHPEIVRFLVSKGGDVNAKDKAGRTPLTCTAFKGPLEVFEHLLQCGGDLEKSEFEGITALHQAAVGNQKAIAEMLLDGHRGMDLNGQETETQATPLHWTACRNDRSIVRDNVDVAELLIARGADVNARNGEGETVLHWAAATGCVKVLKLALDHGAVVDARNLRSKTAFMSTYESDSHAAAALLVACGADVNAKCDMGQSIVHFATAEESLKVLQLAIDRDAEVDARDHFDITPLLRTFPLKEGRVVYAKASAQLLLAPWCRYQCVRYQRH
uniref:Uncharacterized protein n=1 Tax=Chromera velia CCMP2878 TaxID=1169474 RepID=A0A0G4HTT2_9ALVE|eukprot:Cvel_8530.t1-p1 / transcript=Cvel_8530.t1 / gene=Cvel_8530 / organism=Chromera_velia_CCMP2878 / gene_product=Putative ankyrin repeat protein RF_0381, putative / transcript_product=Putative ankyrin repeat protein RF_0381, putative / location=Cvel_scaffold473:3740-5122(+) / protein_length=461 / sequence_SO=supercontig / SO=protein_coding / is_pseudo=false